MLSFDGYDPTQWGLRKQKKHPIESVGNIVDKLRECGSDGGGGAKKSEHFVDIISSMPP